MRDPTGLARREFVFPCTLFLAGSLIAGCQDSPQEPAPMGSVRASVTVIGEPLDPDGFTVVVDDGPPQRVAPGAVLVIVGLSQGAHRLELRDLADQCFMLDASPRTIDVVAAETTVVEFEVLCGDPSTTAVRVTVVREGLELFDGIGVRLDDFFIWTEVGRPALYSGVIPGPHRVTLEPADPVCSVVGANPREIVAPPFETTDVLFTVRCGTPGHGGIRLRTADAPALGIRQPVSAVLLGANRRLAGRSDFVFGDLVPGTYHLDVVPFSRHCAVDGDNPQAVDVLPDRITLAEVRIVCKPGAFEVSITTTGSNRPASHTLVVWYGLPYYCEFCRRTVVLPNSVQIIDQLPQVDLELWLDGPANCTVSPASVKISPGTAADPVRVAFRVACR